MGISNLLPSQHAALVGVIDPDAYAVATYTTGWVSMADFESIMALIMAGDLGVSATVNAKIQQATNGAGSGAKDITGKAITQLTKAGSDDNKQAVINVAADELDNGFTHVQLRLTLGQAGSDAAAALFGFYPHYDTADANDVASVAEIVA